MKMGQEIEVDRSSTGNGCNRDYMYYDMLRRTESKRNFKDELINQTKEIDMSLATLRDFKEQVEFDPHNFQSYFNHLQVVGIGGSMNFKNESISIRNNKDDISINSSLLKKPTHNKDQSSKDTKETGITEFSANTESNNFNKKINRKNSLRQSCSLINQVPQDEKLAVLRSISINEFEKEIKNTLEFNEEKNDIDLENLKKIESPRENIDIQIEDFKERQQECQTNILSNEQVKESQNQGDNYRINNLQATEPKDEKLVELDLKDNINNVQTSNLINKPIQGKTLTKKNNNKACCMII